MFPSFSTCNCKWLYLYGRHTHCQALYFFLSPLAFPGKTLFCVLFFALSSSSCYPLPHSPLGSSILAQGKYAKDLMRAHWALGHSVFAVMLGQCTGLHRIYADTLTILPAKPLTRGMFVFIQTFNFL